MHVGTIYATLSEPLKFPSSCSRSSINSGNGSPAAVRKLRPEKVSKPPRCGYSGDPLRAGEGLDRGVAPAPQKVIDMRKPAATRSRVIRVRVSEEEYEAL